MTIQHLDFHIEKLDIDKEIHVELFHIDFCSFIDVDKRDVVNAQQHDNGVFDGPRAQKSI